MPPAQWSSVWMFFEQEHMVEGKGTCICKYLEEDGTTCGTVVRTSGYSTSPLRSHLNVKHPEWKEKVGKQQGVIEPNAFGQQSASFLEDTFQSSSLATSAAASAASSSFTTKKKRSRSGTSSHTNTNSETFNDLQNHLISNLSREGIPLSVLQKSHWQDFFAKWQPGKSKEPRLNDKKFVASAESAVADGANMAGTKNVILGVTGSVATVKCYQLVRGLAKFANVKVITTYNAKHFLEISPSYDRTAYHEFKELKQDGKVSVYSDEDEWIGYHSVHKDPVLHIEMTKWADLMLVAPASANTLAKVANGQCDNLLTSVIRAWDFDTPKPLIMAPAMNTHMWQHPFTEKHIETLREELQVEVIDPIEKELACGDKGIGAMEDTQTICNRVQEALS